MGLALLIHIVGGGVGIVSGYVAVSSAKGGRLHRASGILFVASMLVMAISGAAIAALHGVESSVVGGVLAAYFVVTGLTAVRPPATGARWLDVGAMVVAVGCGVTSIAQGMEALRNPGDVPAGMILLFGAVALLAGAGDLRMIRAGGLRGQGRIARHLWRMCYALWIATGSFFLGQADEFPEALRIFPLLAIPAFLPLLLMAYWLWRVRIRGAFRGMRPPRALLRAQAHTPGLPT